MSVNQTRPSNRRRTLMIGILTVVLVLCLIGALEKANVTHFFHEETPEFTSTPTQGGSSVNNQKGETSNNSNHSQPSNDKSDVGVQPTGTLLAPSGNFVSNHHPHLSSASGSSMSSVCNTSPGASCTIKFTKDAVTKQLPVKTADTEGAVYWSWKLQDIKLDAGTWQVIAVASSGNQTKSTGDVISLVVAE